MKDLVFGFGSYCEYGLGTKYKGDWDANWDTTETTIEQFTFNPNLAYKITDWWSISAGARMSYITFENYGSPYMDLTPLVSKQAGMQLPPGLASGYGRSHLEGDDFNCGWVIGTQFKVTDDLKIGAVYRSRIRHVIEGDIDSSTPSISALGGMINVPSQPSSGDAEGRLTLPSSAITVNTFRKKASLLTKTAMCSENTAEYFITPSDRERAWESRLVSRCM
jgi:long-chain fatty acid transport protein